MSKQEIGKMMGLISVMVLCIFLALPGAEAGLEGDHDGDIVLVITVLDGREPLEDATIDVYNETDSLVDAGSTDSEGTWILATNQSLEESEVRVNHENMSEAHIEEIDISLPEDENETVIESLTVQVGRDLVEEGQEYYRENQAIVLGGGILFLGVILVVVNRKRLKKSW